MKRTHQAGLFTHELIKPSGVPPVTTATHWGKPGGGEQRKEVERACADGDVDRAIGSDLLLVHRVRPLVGVDMAGDAQVHLVSVQQPWPR